MTKVTLLPLPKQIARGRCRPDPVADGRSDKRLVTPKAARLLLGKGKLTRALFHFFLGGLLDLLGLRDGVFPGVVLLSRRR